MIYILPPLEITSDASQYNEIAHSITDGKGYALKSGDPTAIRPPLYPLFLAGIYTVLGYSIRSVQVIQCCLLSVVCIIIYYLGCAIFDARTGHIASIAAAIHPMLMYPSYDLWSEALLIFLFALTILLILKSTESRYYAIFAGMLLALSVLTKPTVLFALPFFLFFIFLKDATRKRFASMSIFLVAFLLIFVPWTTRNYLEFRSFIPISSGGGIAFFDSHILPARGLGFSAPLPKALESIKSEAARDHFLKQYTLEYIVNHPQKIVSQTVLKVAMFCYPLDGYWYPFSFGSRYNIFWGTTFLFSLSGILYGNRKDPNVQLLLWTILSFLIAVSVFQGIPRYRLAIEPVFILFAAAGLIYLSRSRRLWVIGILVLNFFIWLMFRYYDFRDLLSWDNVKDML
jgi:4-amino-4-deoxy-L-arabinose transferase-like glycosyltransferase